MLYIPPLLETNNYIWSLRNPWLLYRCKLFTFLDINECSNDEVFSCHEHAACKNTKGGYSCICKPGYFGNGKYCLGTCSHASYFIGMCNHVNDFLKIFLLFGKTVP